MRLKDITSRTIPPLSWAEGENIPWNDPDFSRRMLAEHLSQEHNLASRRFEIIDRQVGWIHGELLSGRPTRLLELACGPGLYTSRLARLGHACVGIDYAPEPIRYARDTTAHEGLDCRYRLEDVRNADYGGGYGLVMMIFGQFNVFRRSDACRILEKALSALAPDGILLLEPQKFDTVMKHGQAGSSWHTCGEGGGLFSDRPHLCLTESFWDTDELATTQRFFIVDAGTGAVTRHAMTSEAYTDEQFRDLLTRAGFEDIRFYPSLVGVEVEEESQSANLAIVARKGRR
ncbi:MAG: class I SAM-dependent methyltransferase [Deltaproteobacteria bacterium HGW-Deltaproteobacteria-19]|nr:MAG: class I SAM-dependent methyltransferase [Deltaproteobacteria bacterium HGW-Deltaproteobacteria-19]